MVINGATLMIDGDHSGIGDCKTLLLVKKFSPIFFDFLQLKSVGSGHGTLAGGVGYLLLNQAKNINYR